MMAAYFMGGPWDGTFRDIKEPMPIIFVPVAEMPRRPMTTDNPDAHPEYTVHQYKYIDILWSGHSLFMYTGIVPG